MRMPGSQFLLEESGSVCSEFRGTGRLRESRWLVSWGAVSRTPVSETALRAQEREHREHAAMGLRVRAQAELPEDRGDVLLDGALGDDHALGDRDVREALGHQLEHLALARGERADRVVRAAAADEL